MLQGWTEIPVSLAEFSGLLNHKFPAQHCNECVQLWRLNPLWKHKGKAASQELEKCKGGSAPRPLADTVPIPGYPHPRKRLPWPPCAAVAAGQCPHAFATLQGLQELPLWQGRSREQCSSAPFRVWLCFPPAGGVRWAEQPAGNDTGTGAALTAQMSPCRYLLGSSALTAVCTWVPQHPFCLASHAVAALTKPYPRASGHSHFAAPGGVCP